MNTKLEDKIGRTVLWLLSMLFVTALAYPLGAMGVMPVGPEQQLSGAGGYVPEVLKNAPHPFSFDRPRFWRGSPSTLAGVTWGVLLLGPRTDDGSLSANLKVTIRPTAARDAEAPAPAGPLTSLDAFVRRHLPFRSEVLADTAAIVDGREARQVTSRSQKRLGPPHGAATGEKDARAISLFFEDREYYYMLSYEFGEDEFDRYMPVFERMVASFRFLD